MKGEKKQDLRHSTGNIRFYIGDFFFSELSLQGNIC